MLGYMGKWNGIDRRAVAALSKSPRELLSGLAFVVALLPCCLRPQCYNAKPDSDVVA